VSHIPSLRPKKLGLRMSYYFKVLEDISLELCKETLVLSLVGRVDIRILLGTGIGKGIFGKHLHEAFLELTFS
jgi:hypothetical protein